MMASWQDVVPSAGADLPDIYVGLKAGCCRHYVAACVVPLSV
jgi:hypothetical protein